MKRRDGCGGSGREGVWVLVSHPQWVRGYGSMNVGVCEGLGDLATPVHMHNAKQPVDYSHKCKVPRQHMPQS